MKVVPQFTPRQRSSPALFPLTTIGTRVCVGSTLALLLAGSSLVHGQWESRRTDLPNWENGRALDVINSKTAVVSTDGVYRTTDAGLHWVPLGGPSGMWSPNDVSAPDTSAVWAALVDGRILKWQQSSGNWQEQYRDTNATTFMNYVKMFDAQHGIAMGDARNDSGPAVFLRTTDGGTHWVSVNDSAFGGLSGSGWNRLDFINLEVGYFFESGVYPQKLYKTTDGCRHWQATALPESLFVEGMKFYSAELGLAHTQRVKNVNGMWIFTRYIARTIDGGASWQAFDAPENVWGGAFAFLPQNPAKVWMTDNVKLYFSADTGRTWSEELDNGGRDIQFSDSLHGWLLGDKGVLYYTANGGDPTSVVTAHREGVRRITLAQNNPNPFNPTTVIQYGLPSSAHVLLEVFDLLGRKVATLVDENQLEGYRTREFDAGGYASGVYIYRLTAVPLEGGSRFSQVRKMVLAK